MKLPDGILLVGEELPGQHIQCIRQFVPGQSGCESFGDFGGRGIDIDADDGLPPGRIEKVIGAFFGAFGVVARDRSALEFEHMVGEHHAGSRLRVGPGDVDIPWRVVIFGKRAAAAAQRGEQKRDGNSEAEAGHHILRERNRFYHGAQFRVREFASTAVKAEVAGNGREPWAIRFR